jgi:hypothetical protein
MGFVRTSQKVWCQDELPRIEPATSEKPWLWRLGPLPFDGSDPPGIRDVTHPAKGDSELPSIKRLLGILRSYRSREAMRARKLGKSGAMQNLS